MGTCRKLFEAIGRLCRRRARAPVILRITAAPRGGWASLRRAEAAAIHRDSKVVVLQPARSVRAKGAQAAVSTGGVVLAFRPRPIATAAVGEASALTGSR